MALTDADATLIIGIPTAIAALLGLRVRGAKKDAIEKMLAEATAAERERNDSERDYLRKENADLRKQNAALIRQRRESNDGK